MSELGMLDQSRLAVMREGFASQHAIIPCLSLEQFRRYVLPANLTECEVESVLAAADTTNLKATIVHGRGELGECDDVDFFEHMKDLCERIVLAGRRTLKQLPTAGLRYVSGSATSTTEQKHARTLDCSVALVKSDSELQEVQRECSDVLAVCEFKRQKTESDAYENQCNVIWNMFNVMRDDPCRRFVFGITIEDKRTRLWYANRADIFVSDAFDYIENLNEFVEIFARLFFSSKTDLGWDDSIVRVSSDVYRIRVGDRYYTTEDIVVDNTGNNLTGSATRLWLARDDLGERVVLKDAWPNIQSRPEHEVQELLMRKATELDFEKVKRHFFTILSHEEVKIGGIRDTTRDTIMRGIPVNTLPGLRVNPPTDTSSMQPGVHNASLENDRGLFNRSICHRYHYRLVLKETATPVRYLDNLEHAITAYCDAFAVIAFLSDCGWIHRDISPENVYYYNGRGIVGGFEYAKEIDFGAGDGSPVGDLDYVAVEVESRQFKFRRVEYEMTIEGAPIGLKSFLAAHTRESVARRSAFKVTSPIGGFYHNPIHDAESVWWCLVGLLFRRRIVSDTLPELEEQYQRTYGRMLDAISQIFPDDDASSRRSHFLMEDRFHASLMSTLPSALEAIATVLTYIRVALIDRYVDMERTDNPTMHKMAYNSSEITEFAVYLFECVDMAKGMRVVDFPDDWAKQVPLSPSIVFVERECCYYYIMDRSENPKSKN